MTECSAGFNEYELVEYLERLKFIQQEIDADFEYVADLHDPRLGEIGAVAIHIISIDLPKP